MIKFFRKIRQRLVSENKFSKYLLYAVGEIILVVIGILIALQINNWKENKSTREKEISIIKKLEQTLQINSDLLEVYMSESEAFNKSINIILKKLESDAPYHDSLDVHFHLARLWIPRSFLSNAGYVELQNAGYDILSNEQIKDEIIHLYETAYPQMQKLASSKGKGWGDFIRANFIRGVNDVTQKSELKPLDFQKLKTNILYKNHLIENYHTRKWFVQFENECLNKTQKVIQLLNDELEK